MERRQIEILSSYPLDETNISAKCGMSCAKIGPRSNNLHKGVVESMDHCGKRITDAPPPPSRPPHLRAPPPEQAIRTTILIIMLPARTRRVCDSFAREVHVPAFWGLSLARRRSRAQCLAERRESAAR